jgi:hypothetical protein
MNYIEKLHWYTIEKSRVFDNIYDGNKYIAKNSAEITENIAIEFTEWQQTLLFTENSDWLIDKSTKELFDEFLKTKQ